MVRVAPELRREAAVPCFVAFLLCLFVYCVTWTETTGQNVTTPLSLLTGRFGEVKKRVHNVNLKIKKRKLITLCRSEWPTFKKQPPAAVLAVRERTTRGDYRRGQIDTKATAPLYPVLQGGTEEDLLFPPPYRPHPAPPLPPPPSGVEGRAPAAAAGAKEIAPEVAPAVAGEKVPARAGIARGDGPAQNTRNCLRSLHGGWRGGWRGRRIPLSSR
ncbi:uncharacterized protein LOC101703420 [Heterocephalus glaber]|uniref:Uncharacterized protein LOC101703420 n=1 Tax=Heterocephalus glaber TaxID=10181 RepID=A0AAX6NVZ0_HETGA|nr:uncharacterized protein LOC101703420 [Heterocephalus glaber]